jgi:hypothetical protein
MKSVTVPDDFAGREVTCPSCNKTFDAPAKYTPTVLGEPPPAPARQELKPPPALEPAKMSPEVPADRLPPGLVPPAPPPLQPAASPGAELPLPAGYTHARGFAVNPRAVAWLPAVLLTVTVLCTFGPWVGMYFGGYPVYSQGPWSAMFGAVNPNFALVEKMQLPGGWLDKVTSDWGLMVPYVLVLLLATALALADRGFHSLDPRKIPPIAGIWKWRKLTVAVLAALAFTFVMIQVCNGFGLERAIRKVVSEQFAKEREEAAGSRAKQAQLQYREDQEFAKYGLERATWLYVGLTCNLLAVLAMLAHIGLDRRGDKPPPRLVVQY